MEYEIVFLEEKNVAGFSDRTNNASPDMGAVIGGLWQKLYLPENCSAVKDRVNEKALGIYMDYSSEESGDYTVMAGFEVKMMSDKMVLSMEKFLQADMQNLL